MKALRRKGHSERAALFEKTSGGASESRHVYPFKENKGQEQSAPQRHGDIAAHAQNIQPAFQHLQQDQCHNHAEYPSEATVRVNAA